MATAGTALSTTVDAPIRRGHFVSLDGLRALAVSAVFVAHYVALLPSSPVWWWGITGVDIFFVLSGFLITGILFDSCERPNFFKNFYIRRALRIFPLYYAVWGVFLLSTPFLHLEWNKWMLTNVYYASDFISSGPGHPDPGVLHGHVGKHLFDFIVGHFWTLSIEEQFYFIWPAVVFLIRKRTTLLRICIAVAVFEPVFRTALFLILSRTTHNVRPLYYLPFTRVDSLLIGGAGALWLRDEKLTLPSLCRFYRGLLIIPPAVMTILMLTAGRGYTLSIENPVYCTIGFTLISLTALGAVLSCVDEKSWLAPLLRVRPLVSLGTVSYGFYVFHCLYLPFFFNSHILSTNPWQRLFVFVVAFAFTYGVAKLSYVFFESPLLRYKDILAPARPTQP